MLKINTDKISIVDFKEKWHFCYQYGNASLFFYRTTLLIDHGYIEISAYASDDETPVVDSDALDVLYDMIKSEDVIKEKNAK
jgi:hypothetical protein